jgi:hypothetical protein
LEKDSGLQESPFPDKKELAERKVYGLSLELLLIQSDSGEILYSRNFKEDKKYENPKQTAYFAFFDLIQRVKQRFFRDILGEDIIQERYLLTK